MPSARELLLDAARAVVLTGDWDRARVGDLAAAAGVSRQTLYNEFGGKDGLAQALASREAERFLAGTADVLSEHPDDPVAGIRAAVAFTLSSAADDPLLKAILASARGASDLLPFLTTRAEPLLVAARDQLTAYCAVHWPHLPTRDVRLVAESLVRLSVSHLVLPMAAPDRVADDLAVLAARALHLEDPR